MDKDLFKERKEKIYGFFSDEHYKPMKFKEITNVLCIPREDKEEFRKVLEELLAEGKITIDMKGSVAVILELLNNINSPYNIAFFITSDEEIDGNCVYELLKIYKTKLAIVPDGGTNFQLITEEKGLLQLELSINTKSAHASQPFNGENAIVSLYQVYDKLIKKYPLPQSNKEYITSINLSTIVGGTAINQVPDTATMKLDIRHIAKDKKGDFINYIKEINPDIIIKTILEGSVFKTNIENKEIKKYLNICKKHLKKDIEIIGCESTSDAVYFSNLNIPTIIMNPKGYYPHCENEYVNKDSLVTLYNIYKEFIE